MSFLNEEEVPYVTDGSDIAMNEAVDEALAPLMASEDEVIYQPTQDYIEASQDLQPLTEVQRRLEKAILYQQWISGSLYENQTQSTLEVEQEFKAFALKQLNKLIGLQVEESAPTLPLDEVEIKVLKALAQNIIKNPKVLGTTEVKPSSKPGTKPTPKSSVEPKRQVGRPSKTPVVPAKPILAPKSPVAVPKPSLLKKVLPVEIQQTAPVAPSISSVPLNRPSDVAKPLWGQDGEIIQENNKTYEIKWIQVSPNRWGPAEGNRIQNMALGSVNRLRDGSTIHRTVGDEFYMIIKRDKTPKVTPVNAIPMPTGSYMEQVSAMVAHQGAAASASQSMSSNVARHGNGEL